MLRAPTQPDTRRSTVDASFVQRLLVATTFALAALPGCSEPSGGGETDEGTSTSSDTTNGGSSTTAEPPADTTDGGSSTADGTTTGASTSSSSDGADTSDGTDTTGDDSTSETGVEPGACRPGLVPEGSFEGGTPNPVWEESSTNFGSPICDGPLCGMADTVTGSWWAWFGGIDDPEEGAVSQVLPIPTEITTLSLWVRVAQVDANGEGTVRVLLDEDVLFEFSQLDAEAYVEYTQVILDISAYADGADHVLRLEGTSVGDPATEITPSLFVDDVSICE